MEGISGVATVNISLFTVELHVLDPTHSIIIFKYSLSKELRAIGLKQIVAVSYTSTTFPKRSSDSDLDNRNGCSPRTSNARRDGVQYDNFSSRPSRLPPQRPVTTRQFVRQCSPRGHQAAPGQECQFLDKLPRELRDKVYRHELFNPNLAERIIIEQDASGSRGESFEYKLTPALLRTCKQIYREASYILYRENTFLISFAGRRACPICPLTRYPSSRQGFNQSYPHPSLKVRRWKIDVDLSNDRCDANFKHFCRLLARSSPGSLEISLVPARHPIAWPQGKIREIRERLKPLLVLRNIDKFALSDVPIAEARPSTYVHPILVQFQVRPSKHFPSLHLLSLVKG